MPASPFMRPEPRCQPPCRNASALADVAQHAARQAGHSLAEHAIVEQLLRLQEKIEVAEIAVAQAVILAEAELERQANRMIHVLP
jgi:hypothetical protein